MNEVLQDLHTDQFNPEPTAEELQMGTEMIDADGYAEQNPDVYTTFLKQGLECFTSENGQPKLVYNWQDWKELKFAEYQLKNREA